MMLLGLTLWACSDSVPETNDVARAALQAHMRLHLASIDATREALVRGDLSRAKEVNRAFLDHHVAFDLPGDWMSHVTVMGEAAVALEAAKDIPAAALHAAAMVEACGACHEAVNVEISWPRSTPSNDHAQAEAFRLQSLWYGMMTRADQGAGVPGAKDAASALAGCADCHVKGLALPSVVEPLHPPSP